MLEQILSHLEQLAAHGAHVVEAVADLGAVKEGGVYKVDVLNTLTPKLITKLSPIRKSKYQRS